MIATTVEPRLQEAETRRFSKKTREKMRLAWDRRRLRDGVLQPIPAKPKRLAPLPKSREELDRIIKGRNDRDPSGMTDEEARAEVARIRARNSAGAKRRRDEVRALLPPKPEITEKRCTICGEIKALSEYPKHQRYGRQVSEARCLVCKRRQSVARNRAGRFECLSHYSGGTPKCACCGESMLEFLSIDHIHGGGAAHRKEVKGMLWSTLRKQGYPAGIRVLCHNCNQALGAYGYCPHQRIGELLREEGV